MIVWALESYFPRARTLLEVGSGSGFVLAGLRRALPRLSLTGGELYEEGLRIARERVPDVPLLQFDAREIPFEDEFDVAAAFDVLEHVAEDDIVLERMRRAVVPGGGVLITVPQHPRLWSTADDLAQHRRRYSRGLLVERMRAAGLEVVRVTSFVSLLLPLMAASRLRRRSAAEYDPLMELRAPRALDAACDLTMRAERALIGLGVSFPAGGSLLAVAKRS